MGGSSTSDAAKKLNPLWKVYKIIDDSAVTIHYTSPEQMFLEFSVWDRQGFLLDVPFSKQLDASADSFKFQVGSFATGTYYIQCRVDHSVRPISTKMFRHSKHGQHVTYSDEETMSHNKLPSCDQAMCKIGDLASFDDFFKKYPDYIDKGEVFERALLAYTKLGQDTLLISKTIDSLVTYLPGFYTYYMIGLYLSEYEKAPSLQRTYILKARQTLSTIPSKTQNQYRAKIDELEKHNEK